MRILILLCTALHLTGCGGLAVGTYGTFETIHENFRVTSERLEFGRGSIKPPYTQEQIIKLWGKPDEQYAEGKCTVLSYHDGYNWAGIGAFVVILPLPLLAPSGKDETKLYFINNQSVAATTEYGEVTSMYGYMCGSNECGTVSGAVNTDRKRKVTIGLCN